MKNKIIRRKYLTCRLSTEEKEIITNEAIEHNQDVSDYVREKLFPENKDTPITELA